MTYEQIFKKVTTAVKDIDVSNIKEHLAFQFNITGEGEGIFYAEINEGKLFVEPYDYKDNDAVFIADANTMVRILSGKSNPVTAVATFKLKIEGNMDKALILKDLLAQKSEKKVVEKKPLAKKSTTRKKCAKTAEAKETVSVAKAEKTVDKKVVGKKSVSVEDKKTKK